MRVNYTHSLYKFNPTYLNYITYKLESNALKRAIEKNFSRSESADW